MKSVEIFVNDMLFLFKTKTGTILRMTPRFMSMSEQYNKVLSKVNED